MTRSVDGRSIKEALKKPSIPGFRARGRARPRWWCPRTSGDTSLCDQLLHLEPLAYGRRVAQTTLPLTDTCPVCALQALAKSLSDCDRLLADRRDGPKASPWAAAVASIAGARDVLKRRAPCMFRACRGCRTGCTRAPCAPPPRPGGDAPAVVRSIRAMRAHARRQTSAPMPHPPSERLAPAGSHAAATRSARRSGRSDARRAPRRVRTGATRSHSRTRAVGIERASPVAMRKQPIRTATIAFSAVAARPTVKEMRAPWRMWLSTCCFAMVHSTP